MRLFIHITDGDIKDPDCKVNMYRDLESVPYIRGGTTVWISKWVTSEVYGVYLDLSLDPPRVVAKCNVHTGFLGARDLADRLAGEGWTEIE